MKSPIFFLVSLYLFFSIPLAISQPDSFSSTGIGGGGGLFSPSINPYNEEEYYTVCDLGALFHTTNAGAHYEKVHFTEVLGDIYSKVSFTNDNNIRYVLKWDEENYATRPAKSIDGGLTWEYIPGDTQPGEDRYFIYADYNDTERVVWTTYDQIWISTDGGLSEHWLYDASSSSAGVLLSGVFFQGDTIYFGTNDGVLISTDGGATLSNAGYTGIPSDERIMGFGAGTANGFTRFFALTGGEGDVWAGNLGSNYWGTIRGVYTMENMSGNWTPKMNGIDTSQDWAVYLNMANNDPNTCYIAGATHVPYNKPLVMKTEDGGETWQEVFITHNNENIFTGYQGYQGDFDYWWGEFAEGFTVNPLNSNHAIITDLGFIHQTLDGGNTWHQKYLHPDDENPQGAPTPEKKYYRGIGLEQTSVWQVYWFAPENIYGCFTDIQAIRSIDGGNYWSLDYTGHDLNTMYRIKKHNTENLWFAATSAIHDMYETTYTTDARISPPWKEGKVLYTFDMGASWEVMKDFGTPVYWLATDPNDADVLYASVISPEGDGGIWKATGISQPASASWQQLPSPQNANLGRAHNIHVLNDGSLVASWGVRSNDDQSDFFPGSGVYMSTDGGNTWQDRSHPDMKYWTQDIVIDPHDPEQNTWYACVWSGWGGAANDLGRLWRSDNRGADWSPMTQPQQFHRVYSVTPDPNDSETLYLTTETEGLWVTHNKNDEFPNWSLVQSYPYHAPRRVFFNPFDENELWVSSFGGGMMYGSLLSVSTKTMDNNTHTFKVFPNPAIGMLHIEAPFEQGNIRICDLLGQVLREHHFTGGSLQIDLSDWERGGYILYGENMEGEKALPLKVIIAQ